MHLITVLLFIILPLSHDVLSQDSFPFNTSVMPIFKDAKTSIHKFSWSISAYEPYYLIDLDAPFTWSDCVVSRPPSDCGREFACTFPLSCDETDCKEAHSYINPTCPSLVNITAKYGCKICPVTPLNPISKTCKISQLTNDLLYLYVTDGRNVFPPLYDIRLPTQHVVSCAPPSLLKSLPKGVRGVAAFSWSALAFPRQVHDRNVTDKFSLCLPSDSSVLGVAFLGEGPFYFKFHPNRDLRSILSYTPMKRKSSKSLGYYIKIRQISIETTPVALPFKIGLVKLSTILPYTTLRSDIYKALITSFSEATKKIPRVNTVKPFSLCLKSSAIRSTGTGFRVPKIDLETESGKNWTIYGGNSMKFIGNGTACFAFVDGGLDAKDPIVVGTFQMENNFMFFDLQNQRLGFSSSLLARGTSCSGFNFTKSY
ncbi:aspartic peptidase A1 family [Artemisia annua]|uniref:Aspartic peptidase A1 family n=1 Tax=Artemisia annua TaxID=35608 RepID=A0A2U1KI24_ARTAN|nr:aspartic peptidase A1 family [Artemisia annua]PWA74941.1 aspartic peptidase A1 family [Artemisia annua]